jgi:DNA-binding FadR family transcriptional regulator
MSDPGDALLLERLKSSAVSSPATGKLAAKIREQALAMNDGEFIGSQEELVARYGVNAPTLRLAMAVLIQEQLVMSRRGVGGGVFVRRPDPDMVTHIVALYLRSRNVTLAEQAAALLPLRLEIVRRAAHNTDEGARARLRSFLAKKRRAARRPSSPSSGNSTACSPICAAASPFRSSCRSFRTCRT